MKLRASVLVAALLAAPFTSCSERRVVTTDAPVFDVEVAPILAAHCVACHGEVAPAAGWRATSYLAVLACVEPSGAPATARSRAGAPILRALDEAPHVGLLDAVEARLLTRWVDGGAPAFQGSVHVPGIIDPRSSAFHGAELRAKRWSPMLDANDPDACGRCHEGAPARPEGVALGATGATPCTNCHEKPGDALACTTCHGDGSQSAPPRDPCFFPADAAKAGAHAVHVGASAALPEGLACSACHPTPSSNVINGTHGNGRVEVQFDPKRVGAEAVYDTTTKTCSVGCHDRGGTRPHPTWTDVSSASTCNDCHASPPQGHFKGACTQCHAEVNAAGTAILGGHLHVNGRVDLGDGSGGCGACHGKGADAWPATGAHKAHETPALTSSIECSSCHVVPATLLAPGHLDGVVTVAFSGRATDRGALPSWNGVSCSDVACHGAKLVDAPAVVPSWKDLSGAPSACGACHGLPPTQHTPQTSCEQAICHGAEIDRDAKGKLSITPMGRALHIDGTIEP